MEWCQPEASTRVPARERGRQGPVGTELGSRAGTMYTGGDPDWEMLTDTAAACGLTRSCREYVDIYGTCAIPLFWFSMPVSVAPSTSSSTGSRRRTTPHRAGAEKGQRRSPKYSRPAPPPRPLLETAPRLSRGWVRGCPCYVSGIGVNLAKPPFHAKVHAITTTRQDFTAPS